jgi:hypothetical protein
MAMNNYIRQCEFDSYRNIIHKLHAFATAVPWCSEVGAPCLQVPHMYCQVRHIGSTQKEVQKCIGNVHTVFLMQVYFDIHIVIIIITVVIIIIMALLLLLLILVLP